MMSFIANWFQEKCPTCKTPLQFEASPLYSAKICAHGHYKVETYHHLGVQIVYEKEHLREV